MLEVDIFLFQKIIDPNELYLDAYCSPLKSNHDKYISENSNIGYQDIINLHRTTYRTKHWNVVHSSNNMTVRTIKTAPWFSLEENTLNICVSAEQKGEKDYHPTIPGLF